MTFSRPTSLAKRMMRSATSSGCSTMFLACVITLPVSALAAATRNLGVDPLSGAELQRIVTELASESPEVVERMKQVTRPPR